MAEGFESLLVWQRAHELRLRIHREVLPKLPVDERWNLGIQIRKSTKSVTANIAEAYGRFHYRDAVRICYIARGSLTETQDHLIDVRDFSHITPELYAELRSLSDEIYRLLNGYIAYLLRQKPGGDNPSPPNP